MKLAQSSGTLTPISCMTTSSSMLCICATAGSKRAPCSELCKYCFLHAYGINHHDAHPCSHCCRCSSGNVQRTGVALQQLCGWHRSSQSQCTAGAPCVAPASGRLSIRYALLLLHLATSAASQSSGQHSHSAQANEACSALRHVRVVHAKLHKSWAVQMLLTGVMACPTR